MELIYGSGTGKKYKDCVNDECPTIVQIGAHDGIVGEEYGFSEWLTQLKDFKLYLIEPIKKHFDKLYDVYKVFGDKVVYCNYAITESNGSFFMSDNEGMSKIESYGPIQVNGKTFDEFVSENSIEKIDLLLLDCEGYEFKILKQIDFSKYKIPCIRYEFYWIPEKQECDIFLSNLGYSISGCYYDDIYNKVAFW